MVFRREMVIVYVEVLQLFGKFLGDFGSWVIVQVSEVGYLIFNGYVYV